MNRYGPAHLRPRHTFPALSLFIKASRSAVALAGSLAAVRAGLGVTVLPKDMAPPGLRIIDHDPLPALDDTEIALLTDDPLSIPARRLRDHIIRALEHNG